MTRQRRGARDAAARPGASAGPLSGAGSRSPIRNAGVTPKPALTLDALGKKCPIPIIMLADKIREIPVGQTIEVLADDDEARRVADAIVEAARTGQIGDGKIFVTPIDHALRIRTGETDSDAL